MKSEHKIFLQELKEKLALQVAPAGTDVAAAVKSVNCQLKDNRMFFRIAKSIKHTGSPALTKVEIITTREHLNPRTGQRAYSNDVNTINMHAELEAAIIKRNRLHFAQAPQGLASPSFL
jgi:hypothetical protein